MKSSFFPKALDKIKIYYWGAILIVIAKIINYLAFDETSPIQIETQEFRSGLLVFLPITEKVTFELIVPILIFLWIVFRWIKSGAENSFYTTMSRSIKLPRDLLGFIGITLYSFYLLRFGTFKTVYQSFVDREIQLIFWFLAFACLLYVVGVFDRGFSAETDYYSIE